MKHCLTIILIVLFSSMIVKGCNPTDGFKIRSTIETDEGTVRTEIYFIDNFIVEVLPSAEKADVIFDLSTMSWQEIELKKTIHFSDCQAWLEASAEKTRTSLTNVKNDVQKRFVESMLEPNFDVQISANEQLTLKNEFFLYNITTSRTLPEALLEQFYLYDQMCACRIALQQRQLPPFTRYAVTDELKAHGVFPIQIDCTFKMIKGEMAFKTTNIVEEISQSERKMIRSFLPK